MQKLNITNQIGESRALLVETLGHFSIVFGQLIERMDHLARLVSQFETSESSVEELPVVRKGKHADAANVRGGVLVALKTGPKTHSEITEFLVSRDIAFKKATLSDVLNRGKHSGLFKRLVKTKKWALGPEGRFKKGGE